VESTCTPIKRTCVFSTGGETLLHRNIKTEPDSFLQAIYPYREDVVIGAECMFSWYRPISATKKTSFLSPRLSLYMRTLHGGKSKNDKADSHKIEVLLRGGLIPMAYVYPQQMRATQDVKRRRNCSASAIVSWDAESGSLPQPPVAPAPPGDF
jgi:hypothetical protein